MSTWAFQFLRTYLQFGKIFSQDWKRYNNDDKYYKKQYSARFELMQSAFSKLLVFFIIFSNYIWFLIIYMYMTMCDNRSNIKFRFKITQNTNDSPILLEIPNEIYSTSRMLLSFVLIRYFVPSLLISFHYIISCERSLSKANDGK